MITGDTDFYQCTKSMHNSIQGNRLVISDALLNHYEAVNEQNPLHMRDSLEQADFVFIHDPQPAALVKFCPKRQGRWIWRCHIDASHPYRHTWRYIEQFVSAYDASVFSLPQFARVLPHPVYIIPPSIDPLSYKNVDLEQVELDKICTLFDLNADAP